MPKSTIGDMAKSKRKYIEALKLSMSKLMTALEAVDDAKLAPTARAALKTSVELTEIHGDHDHYAVVVRLEQKLKDALSRPAFSAALVATTATAYTAVSKELESLEVDRAARGVDGLSPTAILFAEMRKIGLEPVEAPRDRTPTKD